MAGFLPSGVAGLLGVDTGQTWQDRLQEAAYTSPSGTRIKFLFEAVSRETTKRTTPFDFPGFADSYVQQNGHGSRRYPLRCIFTGDDCDRVATAFEAALLEEDVGKLEHPLYGTFDVVPFGDITRREDLVQEANQVIVEVTFWTTTGAVYPSGERSPKNEILDSLGAFDVEAAQQFEDATSLGDALTQASAKATIRQFLRDTSAALQSVSDTVASVRREFTDTTRLLNEGIDVFIGQPLLLAQQIDNLIKAPARALAGIQSRLEGYLALANSIFGSEAGRPGDALVAGIQLPVRNAQIANDFHISDLFAMNAVSGSVLSTVENQFTTKPEALASAEAVLAQFEAVETWRDQGFADVATIGTVGPHQIDAGGSYQALSRAVALTLGYLIEISFTLVPERRIVLGRPRTIIDLSAELYGEVDGRLDFLIQTNALTGDEILELPRGKSIVYYP